MGRCAQVRSLALAALWVVLTGCDETRFRVRTPPGTHLDVFRQASVPTVDILWVVDNSASMAEEQEALAQNFGSFFQYIDATGADFQIGVISTDVYNTTHQGKLLGSIPIITRATPRTAEVFAENVHVGTEGKGDEQGFQAASLALSEPLISTANAGFMRAAAYLFLIFVSDEDDHSFGEVAYFLRHFEQIKGIGNDGMVNIASVAGPVPDGCPDAEAGVRYAALAESSGGLVYSICAESFAGNLDALGFSAAGLKRTFSLSQTAIPESVKVYVKSDCAREGATPAGCEQEFNDCASAASGIYGRTCVVKQSLPDGFAFEQDTNSIRFYGEAVPPFGAIVEVGYIPAGEAP